MSLRNALSLAMLDSIKADILNKMDGSVRVIIISANGPVFSSGHDLKELVSVWSEGRKGEKTGFVVLICLKVKFV